MSTKLYYDRKISLISDLNDLRKNQKLCDFTLKTDDENIFLVHKIILITRSTYFAKLFDLNKIENDFIQINNISSENLEKIIEYMYTGKIKLKYKNINEILKIAILFKLKGLIKIIQQFLIESINENNIWNLLKFENEYIEKSLKKACFKWMLKNIDKIHRLKELQQISLYDMHNLLLTKRPLNCSELKIKYILLDWIEYDLSNRQRHFDDLIKFIHFDKISEELQKKEQLIKNKNTKETNFFKTISNYIFKDNNKKSYPIDIEMISMPINHHRIENESNIYAVTNNGIHQFSNDEKQFSFLSSLVHKRENFGCTIIDNDKIFIGGGTIDNNLTSTPIINKTIPCQIFSITNNTWSCIPAMNNKKDHAIAITLNNQIYIMDKYQYDLEIFNLENSKIWISINIPKLNSNLNSLCTLNNNNCIYALTGWGFHCLDIRQLNNGWCWKNLPKQQEYFSNAIGYKNYLYAFNYYGVCIFDIRTNRWFNDYQLYKNDLKKFKRKTQINDYNFNRNDELNMQEISIINYKQEFNWDVKSCILKNNIYLCDGSYLQFYKANQFEFIDDYFLITLEDENLYGLFTI